MRLLVIKPFARFFRGSSEAGNGSGQHPDGADVGETNESAQPGSRALLVGLSSGEGFLMTRKHPRRDASRLATMALPFLQETGKRGEGE